MEIADVEYMLLIRGVSRIRSYMRIESFAGRFGNLFGLSVLCSSRRIMSTYLGPRNYTSLKGKLHFGGTLLGIADASTKAILQNRFIWIWLQNMPLDGAPVNMRTEPFLH